MYINSRLFWCFQLYHMVFISRYSLLSVRWCPTYNYSKHVWEFSSKKVKKKITQDPLTTIFWSYQPHLIAFIMNRRSMTTDPSPWQKSNLYLLMKTQKNLISGPWGNCFSCSFALSKKEQLNMKKGYWMCRNVFSFKWMGLQRAIQVSQHGDVYFKNYPPLWYMHVIFTVYRICRFENIW